MATTSSSWSWDAIPAKVAGVAEVVVCSPGVRGTGEMDDWTLAACHVSGVSALYRVGGAQAVAAMAYGTDTIGAVDKICGPGNAYVAAAKRLVFGRVDIDMIAGPSEILVLADPAADACSSSCGRTPAPRRGAFPALRCDGRLGIVASRSFYAGSIYASCR